MKQTIRILYVLAWVLIGGLIVLPLLAKAQAPIPTPLPLILYTPTPASTPGVVAQAMPGMSPSWWQGLIMALPLGLLTGAALGCIGGIIKGIAELRRGG